MRHERWGSTPETRRAREPLPLRPLFRAPSRFERARRYMTPRRWLCVALVGAALAVGGFLGGCAHDTPIADHGTVTITWEIGPTPGTHCGWAREISPGHYLVTFRRKWGFDDPCWAHELGHAFGGSHR